jgi:plasmid stability protein
MALKTTLNLDDRLLRSAKTRAAESDRTLTALVEEALRELLRQEASTVRRYRFSAKPVKGGLRPGVDLNDRDALYDLMDGRG